MFTLVCYAGTYGDHQGFISNCFDSFIYDIFAKVLSDDNHLCSADCFLYPLQLPTLEVCIYTKIYPLEVPVCLILLLSMSKRQEICILTPFV